MAGPSFSSRTIKLLDELCLCFWRSSTFWKLLNLDLNRWSCLGDGSFTLILLDFLFLMGTLLLGQKQMRCRSTLGAIGRACGTLWILPTMSSRRRCSPSALDP